jgi:hypothetical protein
VRRDQLYVLAVAATGVALVWAVAVWATGGFVWETAILRISSRDPYRPLIVAALCGVAGWYVAPPPALALLVRIQRALTDRLSLMIAAAGAGSLVYQWLGARPMWVDEEMIALNLRDRTLTELASPLWLDQSAPFGWLALQRVVLVTFGSSEIALRFVPVVFGVCFMAASVWIGRRLMSPLGAALLAVLCCFGQWVTFHCLELKHYSADMFFSVLIPALAAWAIGAEPGDDKTTIHRAGVWWAVAAAGQWFSNGALLVTPACAIVLLWVLWRRGWPIAWRVALIGTAWLVSFGIHYAVSLRHALASQFLTDYWAGAMPPKSIGFTGTIGWFAAQLTPFADKPGGSSDGLVFWLEATIGLGFLVARRGASGAVFTAVPISAVAFTAFRFVPFFERLSLWFVPSLYVGVAYLADSAFHLIRLTYSRRQWIRLLPAVIVLAVVSRTGFDMLARGIEDIRGNRPRTSNRGSDDRKGVRWLMSLRQPGDAIVTTRLAAPAVWWYGDIPLSAAGAGAIVQPGDSPILRATYVPPGSDCPRDDLQNALKMQQRALVYFGFRFETPNGFDDLLMERLTELGRVTNDRRFADTGRAVVVDLRSRSQTEGNIAGQPLGGPATRLAGCIQVDPARVR